MKDTKNKTPPNRFNEEDALHLCALTNAFCHNSEKLRDFVTQVGGWPAAIQPANWDFSKLMKSKVATLGSHKELSNSSLTHRLQALKKGDTHLYELAEAEMSWLNSTVHKNSLLLFGQQNWPPQLELIRPRPAVLYACGNIHLLNPPCVAIVGARKATAYGQSVANKLAAELASNSICTVSGGAVGIDSAALQGAINNKGKAIAVLGSGFDKPYPEQSLGLFTALAEKGLLISEYPLNQPPARFQFLARNRIVVGLSQVVVVVEAGVRSGALSTAHKAGETGIPVLAVPGGIFSPMSKGCNKLIRDGVPPLIDTEDLFLALGSGFTQLQKVVPKYHCDINSKPPKTSSSAAKSKTPAQTEEKLPTNTGVKQDSIPMDWTDLKAADALMQLISDTPVTLDTLAEISEIQPQLLPVLLTELEFNGYILRDLGGYCRSGKQWPPNEKGLKNGA